MNIFQKMSKATEQINKVAKNLKVGIGQNQYKAVGEADVLEAVKPIEIELGIYSYPLSRKIVDTNVFTTTSEYNGKTTEKNNLFLRIETVYRFINVDEPTEFVDITTYGDGVDPQDKAPGKAMTYSDKYALLKAYKIETGDDPDQKPSEPMGKGQKQPDKKQIDTPAEAEAEIEKIKAGLINKTQIASIEAEMQRAGAKVPPITIDGKKYGVTSLAALNFAQWKEVMAALEAMPDRPSKKTDLPL